jgi:hypothetical protein
MDFGKKLQLSIRFGGISISPNYHIDVIDCNILIFTNLNYE